MCIEISEEKIEAAPIIFIFLFSFLTSLYGIEPVVTKMLSEFFLGWNFEAIRNLVEIAEASDWLQYSLCCWISHGKFVWRQLTSFFCIWLSRSYIHCTKINSWWCFHGKITTAKYTSKVFFRKICSPFDPVIPNKLQERVLVGYICWRNKHLPISVVRNNYLDLMKTILFLEDSIISMLAYLREANQ